MTSREFSPSESVILGFDPGKDKCGVAVMGLDRQLRYHEVISSRSVMAAIDDLYHKYPISLLVMGNQTTSKRWKQQIQEKLSSAVNIILVDERYTSLEARDRYWLMYPPKGLNKLLPKGMRTPPRPIDDIVAILLIERYLNRLTE